MALDGTPQRFSPAFIADLERAHLILARVVEQDISALPIFERLDAGGFPVTGPRPSYEPSERWCLGRPDPDWIAAQGGKAVKWIDPTNYRAGMRSLLPAEPVIILMERNPREQARSQIKRTILAEMETLK